MQLIILGIVIFFIIIIIFFPRKKGCRIRTVIAPDGTVSYITEGDCDKPLVPKKCERGEEYGLHCYECPVKTKRNTNIKWPDEGACAGLCNELYEHVDVGDIFPDGRGICHTCPKNYWRPAAYPIEKCNIKGGQCDIAFPTDPGFEKPFKGGNGTNNGNCISCPINYIESSSGFIDSDKGCMERQTCASRGAWNLGLDCVYCPDYFTKTSDTTCCMKNQCVETYKEEILKHFGTNIGVQGYHIGNKCYACPPDYANYFNRIEGLPCKPTPKKRGEPDMPITELGPTTIPPAILSQFYKKGKLYGPVDIASSPNGKYIFPGTIVGDPVL